VSDAGYTLAETLAALAILGMASAGLMASVQVFGRAQAQTENMVRNQQVLRKASSDLQNRLEFQGPFRSSQANRFSGTSDGFVYECGAAAPCEAHIKPSGTRFALTLGDGTGAVRRHEIRGGGMPHFRYFGDQGESDRWPPDSPRTETLRGVVLTLDGASPAMPPIVARLWIEQPARCVFDAITQDCR
jgi:prepilin-type N-terminal cleavage/methylation domain-containing protein